MDKQILDFVVEQTHALMAAPSYGRPVMQPGSESRGPGLA